MWLANSFWKNNNNKSIDKLRHSPIPFCCVDAYFPVCLVLLFVSVCFFKKKKNLKQQNQVNHKNVQCLFVSTTILAFFLFLIWLLLVLFITIQNLSIKRWWVFIGLLCEENQNLMESHILAGFAHLHLLSSWVGFFFFLSVFSAFIVSFLVFYQLLSP